MKYCLILLFLLPIACFAQINISGKIINAADKSPVADASVFLSNATVGNKSNANGAYTLYGVRAGQYELVVTVVGFETYRQTVMASTESIGLPDILLTPKTTELKEVIVRPDADRVWKYNMFKSEFLGPSSMAKQCRILNPDMVDLDFDKAERVLSGSSDDFIEIENQALGYNIKYLLVDFKKEGKINKLFYQGSALFTEMKGTPAQVEKWKRNRDKAYYGSSMQFFRTLIADKLPESDFTVFRLIRTPNTDKSFGAAKYIQTLLNTPLPLSDFAKLTDVKGLFAIGYKDCLYIDYKKKKQSNTNIPVIVTKAKGVSTILTLEGPYAFFDNNGVIINSEAIIFEGSWSDDRMAELLPVDFEPTK